MIIMDETMFPWARDNPIKYWDTYESIIDNFKKSSTQSNSWDRLNINS